MDLKIILLASCMCMWVTSEATPRYNRLKANALRVINQQTDGNLTVSGNTYLTSLVDTGTLILEGDATFSSLTDLGDLTVEGNTTLNTLTDLGYLTVEGNTTLNTLTDLGYLTVEGNTTFNTLTDLGYLTAEGNTTLNTLTDVGSLTGNGNTTLITLTVLGDLNVNNNTTFNTLTDLGYLTVNGNSTLTTLTVVGNITADGDTVLNDLAITGSLFVTNFLITDSAVFGNILTVTETTTLSSLSLLGALDAYNDVVISGTLVIDGALTVTGAATLQNLSVMGNLHANGTLNVTDLFSAGGYALSSTPAAGTPGIPGLGGALSYGFVSSTNQAPIAANEFVYFNNPSPYMSGMSLNEEGTALVIENTGLYMYYYYVSVASQNIGTTTMFELYVINTETPIEASQFTLYFPDANQSFALTSVGITNLNPGNMVGLACIVSDSLTITSDLSSTYPDTVLASLMLIQIL